MANIPNKHVYYFDEGDKGMKELLGGKGANLAEMTKLGIPVPPGFTITTEVCDYYNKNNQKYPDGLDAQIEEKLRKLESQMNARLGDKENPLLVSVRSGASSSMPGMMDTILNLGLSDETVNGMIKKTGNERFVYDAYRRLITMFGNVVLGIEHHSFEEVLDKVKETKGVKFDTDLNSDDLKKVIEENKKVVKEKTSKDFPQNAKEQLALAIKAVFDSWMNKRAITYRQIHNIRGLLGTAVNIQAMVFGNMGETSGTGVAFSRNPSTGENLIYGEYLMNAQGEDVVAGIRTPESIETLKNKNVVVYDKFCAFTKKLELHYKDMQDIEFTIQEGKLYILQTRSGKRTAQAAVRIACELVKEGLIDKKTAILRIEPKQMDQLLHKQLDSIGKQKARVIAKGLPASPGAAVGIVAFTAERTVELAAEGNDVILVRLETSPEDIQGMNAAQGILTARGGMTSHAAIVARGMGKTCVAGCEEISVNEHKKIFSVKDIVVKEGEYITLDGSTGEVILGKVPVTDPQISGNFRTLLEWSNEFRKLKVRANAETPLDSKVARDFGAEGIGLCRTEHMFFEGDRIKAVREMILSDTLEGRKKALAKLEPMQKNDFLEIFKIMTGLPVTIRLLDPPLHEFLPKEEKDILELSREMNVPKERIVEKITESHEFNPMLGFRGCRLGIVYPEITEMQASAIIKAAIEANKEGFKAIAEIEIPVSSNVKELEILKELIKKIADELIEKSGVSVHYTIGTMIELPRACVTADEFAQGMDFFSFGTNDLTQTTYGLSRDDAGKFIPIYIEKGIFPEDPFQTIDRNGVGEMMKIAIEKGRKVNPKLDIGICGEHGGDPNSVEFCHQIGLNYVSCSPYRVPIARLAAAQAALKEAGAKSGSSTV